jgi:uncharacterized protein YecE (DUF72 family)
MTSTTMMESTRIGCAGWAIPRLTASLFNSDGTHLERYSRVFNCSEINSSFYRTHKRETWERWAESVPEEFRFSVKVPKAITHEARLKCTPEALPKFFGQIGFLREKLGPVLVQLPPSFQFDHTVVHEFLSRLRQIYQGDVVWEPRHSSWFDHRANDLMKKFQIARVAADPACVPIASEPGGTSNLLYFRLHGSPQRYYSSYDSRFLNDLASKMRHVRAKSPIWCVFDNTASGAAIQNAIDLSTALSTQRRNKAYTQQPDKARAPWTPGPA